MKKSLLKLTLRFEQDVVHARQRAREISELLGFDHSEQIRLATATSEIARNAFRYAQSGKVEFLLDTTLHPELLIHVTDAGAGIGNLEEILEGRYQSETGLGKGITGTQRLMDSFLIETGTEGTSVKMGKLLPKYSPALTPAKIEELVRKLSHRKSEGPYEEIEKQNQELLKTLAELRSRQEELLQLNAELEDTNRGVVALYAELDDRADALRRMSDAKTSFLSNMSHEFRTPLNSILSLSQMLMQRLDGDLTLEQEKQIAYIRSSAQGLQELVNDLLDLAKVEAGKVEVKPREFEIEDLFGALRGMLKPILQTSSVNLVFEDPADLPLMHSDEGKISQILRNFISNALKYTESGEVRVKAALADDSTVVFSVADTGIGIAKEDQDRVFDEFVQVENRLQKVSKGTGLGLPLSRNLARLLGGEVTLESEVGVGSTFSVRLPIVAPQANKDKPAPLPELQSERVPLLLVEDNRETAFLICKCFENTEFQVIAAHDITTAIDFFVRAQPAAVILDVLIEGESSWNLLPEWRKKRPELPVIVVSVMSGEGKKALALGASAFLKKPVSQEELIKTVRVVTHRGPLRKLLLIDDNELSRYSLREVLAAARVEILEARTGRDGLRLIAEEHPDAVFLDLMMPDMSGFEVLDQLRKLSPGCELPVVIHSSQQLSEQQRERLRLPAVTLLSKDELAAADAFDRVGRALQKVGFSIETTGAQQHA